MKLTFLIWSLVLGHCLAGPGFFMNRQGLQISSSPSSDSPPVTSGVAALHFDPTGGAQTFTAQVVTAGTTNEWGCWAATPFSATNRVLLTYMASQPPFATNGVTRLLILDYSLTADPGAPQRFLATNNLAVYAPPLN
jgi:hypothetical protein